MPRARPHLRAALAALFALGASAAGAADLVPLPAQPEGVPWPTERWPEAEAPPPGVDADALEAAVDFAFAEPEPERPRNTRALLVVHRGRIVAERYAEGFDARTPLLGWSMTKSVTATLAGLLVERGALELDAPAPVPRWRGEEDPRRAVTLRQLLRMSSGLAWEEAYGEYESDVVQMLFGAHRRDMAAFAESKPLAHAPGTHWSYSSGTSLVVAGLLRRALERRPGDPLDFPREALFGPLGMESAVIESDAAGTFVGSSFSYATARDWARLGLLHLRGGVWEGRRLLPEGWVDFVRTPAPEAPEGRHGAHWWLNVGGEEGEALPLPGAPRDLFYASGFEGQVTAVVPSRRLVLVRLGLTQQGEYPIAALVKRVSEALPRAAEGAEGAERSATASPARPMGEPGAQRGEAERSATARSSARGAAGP